MADNSRPGDTRSGAAVVRRAGSAPSRQLRNDRGSSLALAQAGESVSHLVVSEVSIKPGVERGPYHLHDRAENTYLVLSGTLEVQAGEELHRLGPGESIFIPAGVPHATHNTERDPARFLAIYDRDIREDFVHMDTTDDRQER